MDGTDLDGSRVVVEPSKGERRGTSGLRTDYRLVVEDLSPRTSWQELKDFARSSGAGEVLYADLTHRHGRAVGVLEFASYESMQHARRKLDDTRLNGCFVRVYEVS